MRWLTLIVALLIPLHANAAVSDSACIAASTDADCFDLDYTNTGNANLLPYRNLVVNNPQIAEAMDYQNMSQTVRTQIWLKIAQAYTNDGVLDIANPAGLASNVYDTTPPFIQTVYSGYAEFNPILGSKIAHALWLELSGNVPWSIAAMSVEQLRLLLDPQSICISPNTDPAWDEPSPTAACQWWGLVDHSPKDAYDVAVAALGGAPFSGTQMEAWDLLVANVGTDFHHVTSTDSRHATTLEQALVDHVSRQGCHTGSRLMATLLRSINLPADTVIQWFSGLHASMMAPTIDLFLVHGDDIYVAVDSVPLYGIRYTSWTWANINLSKGDAGNALKNERRVIPNYLWSMILRGHLDSDFCSGGMTQVENSMLWDSPQDDSWITAIQHELEARSCPSAYCVGCP